MLSLIIRHGLSFYINSSLNKFIFFIAVKFRILKLVSEKKEIIITVEIKPVNKDSINPTYRIARCFF